MKNRKNLSLILALLFIFTFFLSACKKDSDADNLPTIILDTQSDAEADISSATEYESTHENSSPSPQVDNIQEIVRSTPSPTPKPIYEFYDVAIKRSVEQYLDKRANEITDEDFDYLSELQAFSFYTYRGNITSLRDLPELFPNLRYIELTFSWFDEAQLSMEDCRILEEMPLLRAVDIYSDGLPTFDFARRLPYAALRYTEDAYLSDDNNLAEASVLGKDFIESHMNGHIKEYVKVTDGERVYELIVSDNVLQNPDVFYEGYEAKVFLSEIRNDAYYFLNSYPVQGRIGNASGGLILTDINFDGHKDILVSQGHFGAQGSVTFACYLGSDDTYILNDSFSKIANPALDVQNHRILSTWRNMAVSHSWAMYSYINGQLIETDRLTQEPIITKITNEDGIEEEIEVWGHMIEHFNNGDIESEIYLKSDYSDNEWFAMFYDEDSFWGLLSDKWRTLNNQGTLMDWSIYGSGADAQITVTKSKDFSLIYLEVT